MQIIISIPNDRYEWIKTHDGVTDYQTTLKLYDAVKNGTSFPDNIKGIVTCDPNNTNAYYAGDMYL